MTISPHQVLLNVSGVRRCSDNLITDGVVEGLSCQVAIDTGASISAARPHVVTGCKKRGLNRPYSVSTASEVVLPTLEEAHVDLQFVRCYLRVWVFVVEITDEVILGLVGYHACLRSIGRRRENVLRLGQEEVSLWNAGTPHVSRKSFIMK